MCQSWILNVFLGEAGESPEQTAGERAGPYPYPWPLQVSGLPTPANWAKPTPRPLPQGAPCRAAATTLGEVGL